MWERRRAVLPSDAAEAGARGVGVASARGRADAEAVLEGGHQAVELVRIVQRAEEVAQHLGDRVGVVPRSIVLHRDLLGDEDGVEVMSDERLVEYVGEHAAAFGLLQVLVDMDLELVEVLVHLVRRAVWLGCCANPVGVRLVGLADALFILVVELCLGVEQDLVEHGRAVDLGRAHRVCVLGAEAFERVWCRIPHPNVQHVVDAVSLSVRIWLSLSTILASFSWLCLARSLSRAEICAGV